MKTVENLVVCKDTELQVVVDKALVKRSFDGNKAHFRAFPLTNRKNVAQSL